MGAMHFRPTSRTRFLGALAFTLWAVFVLIAYGRGWGARLEIFKDQGPRLQSSVFEEDIILSGPK